MKNRNTDGHQQQSPLMVEGKAKEKLKKRAQARGVIVNTSVGKATPPPLKKEGAKK